MPHKAADSKRARMGDSSDEEVALALKAAGPSVSLRLLLACVTCLAVAIAGIAVSVVALRIASNTQERLTADATQAVTDLANDVLGQLGGRTALRVQSFFGTILELTNEFLGYLITTEVRVYNDTTVDTLRRISRNMLHAFPEVNGIALTLPDGRAYSVNPYSASWDLYIEAKNKAQPITAAPMVSGYLWHTNLTSSLFVGPLFTVPRDSRNEQYYKLGAQLSPNAVGWAPPSYDHESGGVFVAMFPYYPPATPPGAPNASNGTELFGVAAVGCGLQWISDFLAEQAKATPGSVLFLTTTVPDGTLIGSSHGNTTARQLAEGSNTTYVTKPVFANASSDARVRQGYDACFLRSRASVTVGPGVYLCWATAITDDSGLHLNLVLMVPREHFFAVVDRSAEKANDERRSGTRTTVIVCAAILLVSTALVLALVVVATRPLARLAGEMRSVADLQLSDKAVKQGSAFTEIRAIQLEFRRMTARLAEYKAYMPAAMFVDAHGDHEERDDQSESAASGQPQSAAHPPGQITPTHGGHRPSLSRTSSRSSVSTMNTGNNARHNTTSGAGPSTVMGKRVLDVGLTHATATVLVVDSDGFHRRLETEPLRAVVRLHGQYIDLVGQAVARAGGAVDGFAGDRVMASFNTFIPRTQHAIIAVRVALEVQRSVRQLSAGNANNAGTSSNNNSNSNSSASISTGHSGPSLQPPLAVRVGVATGRVAVGRLGSDGHRATAVVGPPVARANMLVRHCRKCGGPGVLVDHSTFEVASSNALFRPVDVVEYPHNAEHGTTNAASTGAQARFTVKPRVLYEALGEQGDSEGEWMYVLQRQERQRSQEPLVQCFASLLRKDFASAQAALATATVESPGTVAAQLQLQQASAIPIITGVTKDPVWDYVTERVARMVQANALLPVTL